MAEPLYRDPNDFDETQKAVINDGFRESKNCVVMGCAGSGKSCIAMAIFMDLCGRKGRKPVIITKQRSLVNTYLHEVDSLVGGAAKKYVREAYYDPKACGDVWPSCNRVINTYERGIKGWKDKSSGDVISVYSDATDLIVDEAQDFDRDEMNTILEHFNKLMSVHFFGDENQQIYEGAFNQSKQLSMLDLKHYAKRYGEIYDMVLRNNYRLPNSIARFVDAVEGPETRLSKKCFGKRTENPYLLRSDSLELIFSTIGKLVKRHKGQTSHYRAAIICYSCNKCEDAFNELGKLHDKWADTDIQIARVRGALDKGIRNYKDPKGPKTLEGKRIDEVNEVITTAFSSKGLQYDDVFVLVDDFVQGDKWSKNKQNVLHVALTRTEGGLFVFYRDRTAYCPFADIPESIYKTDLTEAL